MLILIVEDDLGLVELSSQIFEDSGHTVISSSNERDALTLIREKKPDIMVLDYVLEESTGEDFVNTAKEKNLDIPPFIVATGFGDEKVAVKMMKLGASDYLIKDVNYLDMLPEVVNKIAKNIERDRENLQLQVEKNEIEQLHKTVLESLDESVHLIDSDFNIQLLNKKCIEWCRSFGLNTDVIGQNLQTAFPHITDDIMAGYEHIVKTGEPITDIGKNTLNGKTIYTETRRVPVKSNGKVTGIVTVVKDITIEKIAEEERTKNEKLLHKVAENFPNSYMSIVNSDLTIGFTSGKEFLKLGVDPDSFVGLSIDQIFKEKSSEIKKYYERTFQGEECSFELFINNQYQLYNTVPLYSDSGKIEQILAVVENITDSKIASIELEKNKTLLDMTQKLSKTGGWEYDVETEEMTWTAETYRIHGIDIDKLSLHESKDLIDNSILCYNKNDRSRVLKTFELCVKEGIDYDIEVPFTKITGENIWIKTNAYAVKEDDKIVRVVGNIQDITDIKLIQERLEKSENEFRLVAQNAPGIVYQYLIDEKGNDRFVYMSQEVVNLYGITAEQVMQDASCFTNKIHTDDVHVFETALNKSMKNLTQFAVEIRIITDDGMVKWMSARSIPQRTKNGGILWTGISIDVTDLKNVEEELKYRNKLDKALFNISNQLLLNPDHSYDEVLKMLGETIDVNRSYIFQFFEDCSKMSNTYEWCSDPAEAQIDNLQNINSDSFPWWMKKLRNHENIKFQNIDELPEEAYNIKESLKDQNIKSLIVVPLFSKSGKLFGFMGFDDTQIHRQWFQAEIEVLSLVADLVVNDYERKEAENQLRKNSELFSKLFKSMPNIVIQAELDGTIIFVNDFTLKLTELSTVEVIGRNFLEFIAPYHREKATKLTKEMVNQYLGNQIYDFILPNGKTFTGEVNGDVLRDENGQPYGLIHTCRDITEEIEYQKAILQSKKSYEDIFNSVSEAIYIQDKDGLFVDVNRSVELLYGYRKEELIGKGPSMLSADNMNDLGMVQRVCTNTFETGEVGQFEFWGKRKNGEVFPKDVITSKGKYFGQDVLITTARDISDRKTMEEELKKSEQRLRTIMDVVPSMIYVKNAEGRFLAANEAVAKSLNMELDQVIGKLHTELHKNREQAEYMISVDRDVIKSGKPIEIIQESLNDNFGEEYWLHTIRLPFFGDEFGEPVSLGVSLDITELKKAEQALQESEEQFRTLVENIPGITYRCKNDKHYTMLFLSEEISKISGYPYTDFIKNRIRSYTSIIHKEDLDHVNIRINKAIESKTTYTMEYRIICSDGVEKWVFEKGQGVFDKNDDLLYLDGVIIDINDRKQAEYERIKLEERLQRAQKLETIGTLAGGIAHDFNNILTPIMGYADMALVKIPSYSPLHEDIEHILTASKRAKALVQQILLFSRKLESERVPIQLHLIISEAIKLMRATIPTTIKIDMVLDKECGYVMADASQIHQVIVNLCTNSFHAMEKDGGKLTISLERVSIDEDTVRENINLKVQDYIKISIADTGVGIDIITKGRIFEPFFTTKTVDKGTGMGLSVVHGIVQQHGGDIQVESESGKGTTFFLYFPVTDEVDTMNDEPELILNRGKERIILCDDEASITKMTGKMLEHMGYEVDTFNSSRIALHEIINNKNKYNLLISDLTMPEMTGVELACSIRKKGIDIPIMIMTGFGDSLSGDMVERCGIKEVVSKPIIMNELAAIVRSVLDD